MSRTTRITAVSLGLLLASAAGTPAAARAGGQKQDDPSAPSIRAKHFDRLSAMDKASSAAESAKQRPAASALAPDVRAAQFAARAAAGGPLAEGSGAELPARLVGRIPHLPDADAESKLAPFVGRRGTGLGDVVEDNPGQEPDTAQILRDLPANVVAQIGDYDDVDFYAFTATAGEYIRVEVVSDRVFGSRLDSYLYLVDEGGGVLKTNDDGFDESTDSFIRFRAPYTGVYFAGVTDVDGDGGLDFDYVLSVSPSRDDIDEDEPNDTTSKADELSVPGTAFGDSDDDEDQDVYEFRGTAGQALVVDVDADLFFSDMDAVVELYDSAGKLIFYNDDFDGRDPRFNIVLPYTGRYFLLVYDLRRELGSVGHYYSLNISTQSSAGAPIVTSYKTRGGRLRLVRGTGFDPTNGGTKAEIDGDVQPSTNDATRPTTAVRLTPTGLLTGTDSITVVNPDGRRSNPILLR